MAHGHARTTVHGRKLIVARHAVSAHVPAGTPWSEATAGE